MPQSAKAMKRSLVSFFENQEGWDKETLISDILAEIEELNGYYADELTINDDAHEIMVLDDFTNSFFDKIIQCVVNIIDTEGE